MTIDAVENSIVVEKNKENGREVSFPGLHPHWKQEIAFVNYFSPTESEHYENWIETMNYIIDDLKMLLSLRHHIFWSQVMFDPSLNQLLTNFLKHCPRHYDNAALPDNIVLKHNEVLHFMFLTFLRISTHKETTNNFFGFDYYSQILKNCGLFSPLRIMDLCNIYGPSNSSLLSKMLENVLKAKFPSLDVFLELFNDFKQIFLNVENKCNFGKEDNPKPLNELHELPFSPQNLDVVLFISDISFNLYYLLKLLPQLSTQIAFSQILQSFCHFSEDVLFHLSTYAQKLPISSERQLFKTHLHKVIENFVELFNWVFQNVFVMGERVNQESKLLEVFYEIISALLSSKWFLLKFHKVYDCLDIFNIVTSCISHKDNRKVYFLNCLNDALATITSSSSRTENPSKRLEEESIPSTSSNMCSNPSTRSIQEVFPDLGDGFILACLEFYESNENLVTMNLLENTLSDYLNSLPRDLSQKDYLSLRAASAQPPNSNVNDVSNDALPISAKSRILNEHSFVVDEFQNAENRNFKSVSSCNYIDIYDDEFDDSIDVAPIAGRMQELVIGDEDTLGIFSKGNPNHELNIDEAEVQSDPAEKETPSNEKVQISSFVSVRKKKFVTRNTEESHAEKSHQQRLQKSHHRKREAQKKLRGVTSNQAFAHFSNPT